MSYYLRQGKSFTVTSKESLDLHEKLPVGNYIVQNSMDRGLYLEQIDNFTDIMKHYGDNPKNADRIYRTFIDRAQSTGVMLTGQKGSGKSLLAKTLSLKGYQDGVPTIVINAAWHGDAFNKLIQSIEQPTIVLFDEFEKVYSSDEQEDILTLLDGVYPSKKLFILTCNDKWRVDFNMRNRPGRIFYMIDFKGLDPSFVREYCEDNLNNKDHIQKTCEIAGLFGDFNFDMLKALVEEMNRYDEAPAQALRILNAKPEYDGNKEFTSVLHVDGKPADITDGDNDKWEGNPLNSEIEISYKSWINKKQDDYSWKTARFASPDLIKIDATHGIYIFKNHEGNVLTLTKVKEKTYNYLHSF